ncbi:hypothetical protein [Mobiluncus mulieris]|uniref:hypothetical protein n=1 Tax=Mobiluncus mulieris TaxID=2052 RepID=UPI003211A16F
MDISKDAQFFSLASQLPVSDFGEKLLHLQPGSKLGLYLLGLSNLSVDATQVELAESALSRPLNWILEEIQCHTCGGETGVDIAALKTRLSHPPQSFLADFPCCEETRVRHSLHAYLTLALKSSLVSLVGDQVLLSLLGIRQLRHPQPILPLLAFALTDKDDEGSFLRIIMGALAQIFAAEEWALPGSSAEVAVKLLAEMGYSASSETVDNCLQIFNDFIYGAGCTAPNDDTAVVLLQYLFSEALQP